MAGMPASTVLVVEDDATIREMVADFLRLEGFTVEEAADGADAIQALETNRPPPEHYCGVLLDLMLPRVSGLEVLKHLRTSLGGYVPVVAMSASKVAADAGAVATLPKPFEIDSLLAVLTRHCLPL